MTDAAALSTPAPRSLDDDRPVAEDANVADHRNPVTEVRSFAPLMVPPGDHFGKLKQTGINRWSVQDR